MSWLIRELGYDLLFMYGTKLRKIELAEVQALELDILLHFKEFAKKHKITCFLGAELD